MVSIQMHRKESLSEACNIWLSLVPGGLTAFCLALSSGIVALPQFAAAQPSIEPRREVPRIAAFSAGTDLVLVPVAVIDRKGASITGLTRDNFTIWDDKTPQQIASFNTQDAPCSVGIVLDTSGSMKEVMRAAKDVVGAFLKASNPEDEFFLLTVSSRPQIQTGITDNPKILEAAVRSVVAGGNTALFDTVYLALDHLRKARNHQRALLVISDGIDNHSRYTAAELMSTAVESDAQIYTIAISEPPGSKKPVELVDRQRGSSFMSRLAERTGGLDFSITNASEAQQAAAEAGVALRNQYVVGFKPAEDASGKLHTIKVHVNLHDVTVRSRNGYRSP